MEGILVNCKNTDGGKATATLVQQALRHKRIFVFGELLALPQVQKLRNSEEDAVLRALEIFAYGTYSDYTNGMGLPELNEGQITKLRQLTIVSLASKSKSLGYNQVIAETGVANIRAAEDLVISCVYEGLLRARLDQKNQTFLIQWCAARDVRPETIDEMLKKLSSWCDSADSILKRIDHAVDNATAKRKSENEEHEIVMREAEHVKEKVMKESSESLKLDDRTGGKKPGLFTGVLPGFLNRRS